jgi:hypothetical protein
VVGHGVQATEIYSKVVIVAAGVGAVATATPEIAFVATIAAARNLAPRIVLGLPTRQTNISLIGSAQQLNYRSFLSKFSVTVRSSARISNLPGGLIRIDLVKLGKVPGSYAVYTRIVSPAGKTLRVLKRTVDPKGKTVHIKDKTKSN